MTYEADLLNEFSTIGMYGRSNPLNSFDLDTGNDDGQ